MHVKADLHETPASVASTPPGLATSDQVVPFQNSASVPFDDVPVAWHALAAVHDTLDRLLRSTPVFDLLWAMAQAVPLKCSTNVRLDVPFILGPSQYPTAVQSVAVTHDTPCRKAAVADDG